MLTNKYLTGIPADSRAAGSSQFLHEGQITPDVVERVRRLNEIAAERGQTLSQMALVWGLPAERVTSVLIGASKVSQIEENVAVVNNLEFSDEELAKIEDILES